MQCLVTVCGKLRRRQHHHCPEKVMHHFYRLQDQQVKCPATVFLLKLYNHHVSIRFAKHVMIKKTEIDTNNICSIIIKWCHLHIKVLSFDVTTKYILTGGSMRKFSLYCHSTFIGLNASE